MKKARVIPQDLKIAALSRMAAGENVSALARELRVRRKLLYVWRDRFRKGGPDALRGRGRRPASAARAGETAASGDELSRARARIAALERKIGQQQVDLDFFRRALRHVQASRQASSGPGAPPSTRSSRR